MVDIPSRNRAVKALLEKTYGKGCASVTAGTGTAYRWVNIKFKTVPEALRLPTYNQVHAVIDALILGAGIELSTYSASDMGGDEKNTCVAITMPRIGEGT